MDRDDAYRALIDHRPTPAILGLKCSTCRAPWPCQTRETALDELTGTGYVLGAVYGSHGGQDGSAGGGGQVGTSAPPGRQGGR